ncbi:MAG TPA: DUF3592 domain-containing protein [Trebonia sp.]|nr:DUF3592 domain-containing protein [Trebonia sp.]
MAIAVGVWIALAGALALLVGVTARRNVRRLRSTGVKAWGTAVHRPVPDHPRGQRVTLQYTLADGRVLERPLPARRAARLSAGEKVLLWYDPGDPTDVLIYGRDARTSDLAFILIGLAFLVIGTTIAAFAP